MVSFLSTTEFAKNKKENLRKPTQYILNGWAAPSRN